jgi:predicted restriction endonuclease
MNQSWYTPHVEEVRAIFYSPIKPRHSVNHPLPQQKLAKAECRGFVLENIMARTKEEEKVINHISYMARREKQKAYARTYYSNHRDEIRAKSIIYHAKHREIINAKKRIYNANHRERTRKYTASRREKQREYYKRYYAEHRQEILAKGRVAAKVRYEARKPYLRALNIANSEKLKTYRRERGNKYRQAILEHYGGQCACCGENIPQFLAIDHINNDGAAHRKMIHGRIYEWLVKHDFPEGFQLLCHNCNMAKGLYGECPHKAKAGQ